MFVGLCEICFWGCLAILRFFRIRWVNLMKTSRSIAEILLTNLHFITQQVKTSFYATRIFIVKTNYHQIIFNTWSILLYHVWNLSTPRWVFFGFLCALGLLRHNTRDFFHAVNLIKYSLWLSFCWSLENIWDYCKTVIYWFG